MYVELACNSGGQNREKRAKDSQRYTTYICMLMPNGVLSFYLYRLGLVSCHGIKATWGALSYGGSPEIYALLVISNSLAE